MKGRLDHGIPTLGAFQSYLGLKLVKNRTKDTLEYTNPLSSSHCVSIKKKVFPRVLRQLAHIQQGVIE